MSTSKCPEVYTQPIAHKPVAKTGQLTDEEIRQFYNEGYVILEDFFDKELLEKAKDSIRNVENGIIEDLFQAGKISSQYEEEGFFTRMTKVNREFPGASILFHKRGVLPRGLQDVWSYPKLLNIVEQLVGPNIIGHTVWNLRVKLPDNEPEVVPWHQDNGYLLDSSLQTMMPTAWIPLLDSGKDNGGMELVKFTQKPGITGQHHCCAGATWYIEMEEEEIRDTFGANMDKDSVVCNVPYGGLLLFSNALIHRSLPNTSDNIRWSLDFRWQDPTKPTGRPEKSTNLPLMMENGTLIENIDWSGIQGRHGSHQKKDVKEAAGNSDNDDIFDTRIAGPWMKRWPIKHHNKHTGFAKENLGDDDKIIGWHSS